MANAVNIFDFAGEVLAAFLAKPVSNGTYADVFGTLKVDQAGEEASATEIQQYAGHSDSKEAESAKRDARAPNWVEYGA